MLFFNRTIFVFFIIDLILAFLHLVVPEYKWGQGRNSFFNLNNELTFADWFITIQLFLISIFSISNYYLEKKAGGPHYKFFWIVISFISCSLSVIVLTNPFYRLNLFNVASPDFYNQLVLISLILILLILILIFLYSRIKIVEGDYLSINIWVILTAVYVISEILIEFNDIIPEQYFDVINTAGKTSFLFSITFPLKATGSYTFDRYKKLIENNLDPAPASSYDLENRKIRYFIYAGIAGLTFIIIFLQIILFRMLYIFGDHLTATGVISIALLGISIGGLIGWQTVNKNPVTVILTTMFILPVAIISTPGTVVSFTNFPVTESVLLMLPFICASIVISIVLAKAKSYKVYAIDLIGAAAGALVVGLSLNLFREEGSIIFLASFALIIAGGFVYILPSGFLRSSLLLTSAITSFVFILIGFHNLNEDWMNLIKYKVESRFPDAYFYQSRSGLVGRYDVLRRTPDANTVKTYENGRVIDNLRPNSPDEYIIDPRIPYNFIEDPEILIIGLSGDGVTKTARAISSKVTGVEINPVVVELQRNELVELNGNSYENIDVFVMDGRSYIEQTGKKFDIITLMNAHSAKGYTKGRSASPEYLHTTQAFISYLDCLTDTGIIIIEEPVNYPDREPAVWKMLYTMREALIDKGINNPENHFFIYQWKTRSNNYIQVLMKKTAFNDDEIARLHEWLSDFDNISKLERETGQRLGPIRGKSTVLYEPQKKYTTNYARIIEGNIGNEFKSQITLGPTTDNRPFHFAVDPEHTEVKKAYSNTLIISLILLPFIFIFIRNNKEGIDFSFTYSLIVGLTGLAYLLIEVVLIEKLEIFLGSPTITFSTVIGSLLIFSGFGSYISGKFNFKHVYYSLFFIIAFLLLQNIFLFKLLRQFVSFPVPVKVILTIINLAPLAFCMGLPFPFILRNAKEKISSSSAAILFAINGAASAIAVPLAMTISSEYGFNITFFTGTIIYLLILIILVSINRDRFIIAANSFSIILILLILTIPFLVFTDKIKPTKTYEVIAVSYGHSDFNEAKLFKNGNRKASHPFEWMFWVIKNDDRIIIVDTGFEDQELISKWGITDYKSPLKKLKKLNINPEDVSGIILTHAHWDHVGLVDKFPNANIYMQKDEYSLALSLLNDSIPYRKGMYWNDIKKLINAEKESRLVLVNQYSNPFEGIEIFKGGSHTEGSQYITVETAIGKVVLAGDATYFYENNMRHIPVGDAHDHSENLKNIKLMHTIAASPFYIIPGHDPDVFQWFPEIADGIVLINPLKN